jgi:hypothetical protein
MDEINLHNIQQTSAVKYDEALDKAHSEAAINNACHIKISF